MHPRKEISDNGGEEGGLKFPHAGQRNKALSAQIKAGTGSSYPFGGGRNQTLKTLAFLAPGSGGADAYQKIGKTTRQVRGKLKL